MENTCTLLLNHDFTFLDLFWIQLNLIIRISCQSDYHALMDQVCAVNKSIYTVNPSHFLVFWPFRTLEFKRCWNRSMGARDNRGGGGAKWAGGGSSKRNRRGRHRRGYTTLPDNCNGRKPRKTGRRTDTGGGRFGPPSSLSPHPLSPTGSIKFGENRGRKWYGRWEMKRREVEVLKGM